MQIATKVHTIFMLIGSTECGKTTFTNEVLIPGLQFQYEEKGVKANIQYLSSDAIRQEVLGFEYDKYDRVMLEASDQAFQLLFTKLKLVTSFPVNADFVIVDTTGLAEDFRTKVKEIALENNYNLEVILFDYRNRGDYYASERSKKLITSHINRLKKDVLRSLSKEGYSQVHKIRAKDFYSAAEQKANADYRVNVENLKEYLSTTLPNQYKYIIVGDIHECIDTFKDLLRSHGFKMEGSKIIAGDRVKDTKIVLVGDWIDKGKQTRETVQFLYENKEHFFFVLGNHENFVYKYLKGDVQGVDQELLHTYFDSTQVLASDSDLLHKFNELVSISKPFYRSSPDDSGATFYVTHAPCKNKYIGKLDTHSIRHQRNFRVDREIELEPQLAFLKEEAVSNHPYHVFGHVAAKNAFRIKNKIHVDTGSVHGNALTSVSLSFKPFFKAQPSRQAIMADELKPLFVSQRKVKLEDLGEDEIRRLRYSSHNKISYISGTMAPADKDEEANELESMKRGLQYFKERGVKQVVLQPKYMGSRCNIYLHQDIDQCFAISRNGYKIKKVDLTEVYIRLLHKFGGYMLENDISMLLLDGELLPWQAMGEGLIQRQFKPIEKALETELAFLKQNGFDEALLQLANEYRASGFEQDQYHISKTILSEKYGSHVYQNYRYLHTVLESHRPIEAHLDAYESYKLQMELYAEGGDLVYKPFALLKIVYHNGKEQIPVWKTSDMYTFLSDDEYLLIDLTDEDYVEKGEQFFSRLTVDKQMEGVVIKPESMDDHIIPYMKVRNAEYLSIIYGYDYRFPHKYNKLMKQKNISQKLRTSLTEYRLGQSMLEIPSAEISPDNKRYKEIAASLLFEVAKEKEIDPRL